MYVNHPHTKRTLDCHGGKWSYIHGVPPWMVGETWMTGVWKALESPLDLQKIFDFKLKADHQHGIFDTFWRIRHDQTIRNHVGRVRCDRPSARGGWGGLGCCAKGASLAAGSADAGEAGRSRALLSYRQSEGSGVLMSLYYVLLGFNVIN